MAAPSPNNNNNTLYDALKDMGVDATRLFNTVLNNRQACQFAQQLLDNKTLYDALKECFNKIGIDPTSCSITAENTQHLAGNEYWNNFLGHAKDQDWGCVDDNMCTCDQLEAMQSECEGLEDTCNPKAFQKSLNWVYIAYFALSVVNLCFSWKQISDTISDLEKASQKLQRISQRLQAIKDDDVAKIVGVSQLLCIYVV